MRMKKRVKKAGMPKSLNKRLLLFMILCWVVPITVFFTFTTFSYRKGIIDKAERLMLDELSNVASFASIRIDEAVSLCQRPSYEKTWENAWSNYKKNITPVTDYLREVNGSLKGKFYLDERFNLYAFYMQGDEKPSCYSSRIGASYNTYVESIQPYIKEIKDKDSSYTYVKVINGRIFIIRNLYTTKDYKKFGTLVVELNKRKVFQDVPSRLLNQMIVCFDDKDSNITFGSNETQVNKSKEKLLENY